MPQRLDIVYVVREGDQNPELRHSLRAVTEHLPHRRIVLSGHTPDWAQNVLSIPVLQLGSKYRRAEANLIAAATHPEVSDPFIYMNDDMYPMRYFDHVPPYSLGPLDEVIRFYRQRPGGKGTYLRGMVDTRARIRELVAEDVELYSYEAHTPIELGKDRLLDVLSLRPDDLDDYHWRTVYGSLYIDIPHVLEHDVKVYMGTLESKGWREWEWLSTSDSTFSHHSVGRFLQQRYPHLSPYEAWD